MKRYIRSEEIIDERDFTGYCFYKASNSTWGGDALRILQNIGGEKGYIKFRKPGTAMRAEYYRPSIVYLFGDKEMYEEFKQLLDEHDLSGFIQLQEYQELPYDAVILELG